MENKCKTKLWLFLIKPSNNPHIFILMDCELALIPLDWVLDAPCIFKPIGMKWGYRKLYLNEGRIGVEVWESGVLILGFS